MRSTLLLLLSLSATILIGQRTSLPVDSLRIPNGQPQCFAEAERFSKFAFGADSIYLCQTARDVRQGHWFRQAYYAYPLADGQWIRVAISLEDSKLVAKQIGGLSARVHYHWHFSNLGDEQSYLIVHWFYQHKEQLSNNAITAGPDAPICGYDVLSRKRDIHGIRIIDPWNHQIVFESILKADLKQERESMGKTYMLDHKSCRPLRLEKDVLHLTHCYQQDFLPKAMLHGRPTGKYQINQGELVRID